MPMVDRDLFLKNIVKFIRNYERSTVDKRNRELIANAVRRNFKR